jgi:hypothetical protein
MPSRVLGALLLLISCAVCGPVDTSNWEFKASREKCAVPKKWEGLHLLAFESYTKHFNLRGFIELYFDRSILTSTFFHNNCSTAPLLIYHADTYVGDPSAYCKRNVFETIADSCMQRYNRAKPESDASRLVCACSYAKRYSDFSMIFIISRLTVGKKLDLVVDVDQFFSNSTYAGRCLQKILDLADPREVWKGLDINRYNVVKTIVDKYFPDSDLQITNRATNLTSVFISTTETEIFKCFAEPWYRQGYEALLFANFAEFQESKYTKEIASFAPTTTAPKSTLMTTVNVLIPSKNPSEITVCLKSIVDTADLNFGEIHFHFGIDWKDNSTRRVITSACSILSIYCEFHEVFARAGDVSAIVNHMFATIEGDAYFLRFNDDSRMLTKHWNVKAITALRQEPVDLGLARLIDHANIGLQTHSFVSAVHRKIFGSYFPVHFKNIYEDDWITATYTGYLTKSSFIRIFHNAKGSRYNALKIPKDVLDSTVQKSRARIDRYVEKHRSQFYSD